MEKPKYCLFEIFDSVFDANKYFNREIASLIYKNNYKQNIYNYY